MDEAQDEPGSGFDYSEPQDVQQVSASSVFVSQKTPLLNLRALGEDKSSYVFERHDEVNDAINTHITSEFIDVMKNEKVKIQPVLLCAADLGGTGGRKEAMQQMLEKTKLSTDSFSSYQMLASKKYHLAEVNTSLELYNYGFQSCKSANTISTASPSFYSHPLLNQHMKILKAQILDSKEHKIKVIANITKLASLIKIWDISVNSNVHHFLRGFSGHLTNSRLWLFADLIDVLNELEGTPASSESAFAKDNNIGSWGSQLDNILRFAMVCNKSTGPIGQRRKPCKVFSSYKKQKGSNRKVVAMPKSPEETERPAEDGQNESSALPSFHRTKEKSVTSTLSPFRTTQQDAVIPIEAPTSQVSSNQDKLDANEDVNQDELDTNEDIISKSQPPYISQDEAADIKKLEEELHHIARQLKVTELLKASVTPLNITCGHYDSQKNLQSHLRNILAQSEEVTIPVSWLFLRGALEHSKNIFMKKAELCEIAKECGIVDENFKAFCKFFTSFGSIFDVSLKHKESDIIIIKTDEFLSKLSQTFDSITASHEQTSHYASDGIITTETVVKLDNTFMTALSQVGITVNIPAGKYGDGRKDVCYYMPCARKLKQDRSINQQAVRALLNIQCPVIINYEVTFTRYMLELCPASRLQSSHHENVTVITPDEDNDDVRVTIIYRGDEIGVKVEAKERHLRLKYATCVISIFEKIAEEAVQSCNCKAEEAVQSCNCVAFTYAFASKCNNEYHMLPHDLCDQCKENEELQVWMEALKKKPISDKFRFTTDITSDDVTFISQSLENCSKETLIRFAKESLDDKSDYENWLTPNWVNVMIMLTQWMQRELPNQLISRLVTKVELARKISVWGQENADNNFQVVARRLFNKVIQETNTIGRRKSIQNSDGQKM